MDGGETLDLHDYLFWILDSGFQGKGGVGDALTAFVIGAAKG